MFFLSAKNLPATLTLLLIFLLHSAPLQIIANNSSETVLYDIYPFVRVYTDGRVQRFFGQDRVPPSVDPYTGVQSKDVKTRPDLNLSVRIFLPRKPDPIRKLPLLVYFHGGGFFSESAFSPTYHKHLNSLVAKANVVAVSVNYRLAPEHPLPIAYEDSWLALKWTFSHLRGNGNEVWLKKYADFGRVYLGGDSVGGNIAHHMAIRVGSEKLNPGIKINGMFLNCPYFWGKRAIGNESAYSFSDKLAKIWIYAYPKSAGLDDPLVNPGMDPDLRKLGCKRVLVYVAGSDILRYRGWYYEEALKKSGWNGVVNVVEVPAEEHVFLLLKPISSPNCVAMMNNLAYFLNH